MKIQNTKNYDQFSYVKGNRIIRKNHLSRLRQSIRVKNLLQYNPIIVNENKEVIDGQHRLEACRLLETDVYYVVANGLGFDDVVRMNTTVAGWGIGDYLDSYCALGVEPYLQTRKFAKKWGLSLSNAIAILSIDGHITRAGYKNFKAGQFEIRDMKEATDFARRLREITPYTTLNTWKDRDFVRALSLAYEQEMEHDALVKRIEEYPRPLHRRANVKEYLRQFEDVYNTGLSANKMRLY